MTGLQHLSEEYIQSGEICRGRAEELRLRLREERLCEMDRLRLRRRIQILMTMARECRTTGRYLARYYDQKRGV